MKKKKKHERSRASFVKDATNTQSKLPFYSIIKKKIGFVL